MTKKAVWDDTILAVSDQGIIVEGNYYFPPKDVNKEYLVESDTHTICPWKGQANYYNLKLKGELEVDIAWYYPKPKEKAARIKNYIAFDDNRVTIK